MPEVDVAAIDEKTRARALDTLILAVEKHQPLVVEALLKAGVPTDTHIKGVNAFEHVLAVAASAAETHPETLRALLAHAPPDAQAHAAAHLLRLEADSQPDAAVSRRHRAAAGPSGTDSARCGTCPGLAADPGLTYMASREWFCAFAGESPARRTPGDVAGWGCFCPTK